jgi:hypothetical protein
VAQTITIAGVTFPDVPRILIPKSGGGNATFAETSVVTATASDVASGKYFLDSSGILTEGTASGGGVSVVVTPDVHGGDIVTITGEPIQPLTPFVIRPDAELLQKWTYDKMIVEDGVATWPAYSTSSKTLLAAGNLTPTITMSYADYHYYVVERMYIYPIYNISTKAAGREEYHFVTATYEVAQTQEDVFHALDGTPYGTRVFTIVGGSVSRLLHWTSSSAMAGYSGTAQGLMITPSDPTAASGVLTIRHPSITVKGNATYLSSTYFGAVTDARAQYIIEVYRVPNSASLIGWGNTQQLLRMADNLASSSHTLT